LGDTLILFNGEGKKRKKIFEKNLLEKKTEIWVDE
jgi:hypothetical protein